MQVIVHPLNEDSFVGEIDALPAAGESYIRISAPRTRDGKPLRQLSYGVNTILVPMHRINFMELMEEVARPSGPTAPSEKPEDDDFVRQPQTLFYRD